MKKNNRTSDMFGAIAVFAVFAGCVERFDGGVSWWTVLCIAVALASGLVSRATYEGNDKPKNTESHD